MGVIQQLNLFVTEYATPKIIAGMIAGLVFVLIVTQVIERRLRKKIFVEREIQRRKFELMIDEIKELPLSATQKIHVVDEIARDYFLQRHKIPKTQDYSEIQEYFNQNKNPRAAHFSQEMLESLYSGKTISKELAQKLLDDLFELVHDPDPNKMPLDVLRTQVDTSMRKKNPVQPLPSQQPVASVSSLETVKNEPKRVQKIGLNALPPPAMKAIVETPQTPSLFKRIGSYFRENAKRKEEERVKQQLQAQMIAQKQAQTARIADYQQRILQCQQGIEAIKGVMAILRNKMMKKEISSVEYKAMLEQKKGGKTFTEWITYYEEYIKQCKQRIEYETNPLAAKEAEKKPEPKKEEKPEPVQEKEPTPELLQTVRQDPYGGVGRIFHVAFNPKDPNANTKP